MIDASVCSASHVGITETKRKLSSLVLEYFNTMSKMAVVLTSVSSVTDHLASSLQRELFGTICKLTDVFLENDLQRRFRCNVKLTTEPLMTQGDSQMKAEINA